MYRAVILHAFMFHHVNTTTERARIIARNPKPWDNDRRRQKSFCHCALQVARAMLLQPQTPALAPAARWRTTTPAPALAAGWRAPASALAARWRLQPSGLAGARLAKWQSSKLKETQAPQPPPWAAGWRAHQARQKPR